MARGATGPTPDCAGEFVRESNHPVDDPLILEAKALAPGIEESAGNGRMEFPSRGGGNKGGGNKKPLQGRGAFEEWCPRQDLNLYDVTH